MKNTTLCLGLLVAACSSSPPSENRIDHVPSTLEAPNACGSDFYRHMATLAAASAVELGRWEASTDFQVNEQGQLELTETARGDCKDGCRELDTVLSLQQPEAAVLGHDPERLSRLMVRAWEEQLDADGERQVGIPHYLEFRETGDASCGIMFWFEATQPECSGDCELEDTQELTSKLVFAGYPDNPYLDFQAGWTGESPGERKSWVGIDPTGWIGGDTGTHAPICEAACMTGYQNASVGDCCDCNGWTGYFAPSSSSFMLICKP